MYITMDCDFFEQTYYYTQPRSQGEISHTSEDLSWLIYPLATSGRDPQEQVSVTADPVPETVVSPPPLSTHVPEHPEQEVISDILADDNDNMDNVVPSDDGPRRYELPKRSTRGVPPRRYDPEFESQRSRYPVEQMNQERMSQTAIAFNASL
jgi:hypothetical protein